MSPLEATIDYLAAAEQSGETDSLTAWKIRALMAGYHERWKGAELSVLTNEETFRLPIVNPKTNRTSRTFEQGGRFDLTVEFDRRHWLMEHKTSSEDIADPMSPYWKRLAIDSQVSMYALANWQDGRKLDGTIYDVIRKPTIRPKQIPKADQKLLDEGKYFGFAITSADVDDAIANNFQETPKLYACRLLRDCLDDHAKYFQRRIVPRLDGEILEFAGELWQVAHDIRQAEMSGHHYRNSGACMNWGRPCDYLPLCSGHDTPDSDKWRVRESAHPEVDLPANVLTHSRIRCFQTCRAQHNFKYNLRIERVDEEEAEALRFGGLFHRALEVYYHALKETQNEHRHTSAANEVADYTQQALAF